MKKGKGPKRIIHLAGSGDTTLCGRPIANSILWAKKTPPTKVHPGLCKKCCALYLDKKVAVADQRATKKAGPKAEKKERKGRTPALAAFPNRPSELVVTYKGTTYKATVNSDGTITVDGKTFNSPSRAGKEVIGKEVDGWTFWSFEVEGEGLKKLDTLRKPEEADK